MARFCNGFRFPVENTRKCVGKQLNKSSYDKSLTNILGVTEKIDYMRKSRLL